MGRRESPLASKDRCLQGTRPRGRWPTRPDHRCEPEGLRRSARPSRRARASRARIRTMTPWPLEGSGPDGFGPVERLRDRVARLGELRREGLRLVSMGDVQEVTAWHREWSALLDDIRVPLDREAPRQAELVLWPGVNGTQPLGQTRVELVRAAVGCRELDLLVKQLAGDQRDSIEGPAALPPPAEPPQGSTHVGPRQRFEGAVMLRRLIEVAQDSLVFVDQYVDAGTFTLAAAAADGISRRFLSSDHPASRRRVAESWNDWRASWGGDSKCRIGGELPHFRLLLVDRAAYQLDASLKDFGSSWTFLRMLPTDELLLIEGKLESMWRQANPA